RRRSRPSSWTRPPAAAPSRSLTRGATALRRPVSPVAGDPSQGQAVSHGDAERDLVGPMSPGPRQTTYPRGSRMDNITSDFGDVLLWSFWFFIWIAALMVWFRCLFDLFGDRSLRGWGKAGWCLLLIFVPWLGALIYLIARGRSMTERQQAAIAQRQADQEEYIQEVASTSQT